MNKDTANSYVRKAMADPLGIDGLLKLEDIELELRLIGKNPAYADPRFEVLKTFLQSLEEEMSRKNVPVALTSRLYSILPSVTTFHAECLSSASGLPE